MSKKSNTLITFELWDTDFKPFDKIKKPIPLNEAIDDFIRQGLILPGNVKPKKRK